MKNSTWTEIDRDGESKRQRETRDGKEKE